MFRCDGSDTMPKKFKFKNKRKRIPVLLAIIVAIGVGVFYMTSPSSDDSMGFTDMILNAENDMISLDQSDPQVSQLLERYTPRVFVDQDSYFPLDFYEDYVPQTKLFKSGRIDTLISDQVSQSDVHDYMYESDYYLDYQVKPDALLKVYDASYQTSVYGRAYKSALKTEDGQIDLIFLKYSLVFPYSGLPSETAWWKMAGSNVIGDPLAWHELDIHGAIHVALEATTLKPVGIILGQHNHHKVHFVGEDLVWPEDDHVKITFSKFSNEPYLADDQGLSRIERTVGNPMEMEFLLGMSDEEPFTAGYDFIPGLDESAIEIELNLVQLSPEDPLYRATMGLGDRKKILGLFRTFYLDGPPGVDFYTLPDMLDLAELMAFWNIDITDDAYMEVYNRAELTFMNFDISDIQDYQRPKLKEKLTRIMSGYD